MPKKNVDEPENTQGANEQLKNGELKEPRPLVGYEQARENLAHIAAQLERGNLSLEESLSLWEQGEKLADICDQWLTDARVRVNQTVNESNASTED